MFKDREQKQFTATIQRATYRNPYLSKVDIEQQDQQTYYADFVLSEPLNVEQIRLFGERLFDSFKDSGFLVNVIFDETTDLKASFIIKYTGTQLQ